MRMAGVYAAALWAAGCANQGTVLFHIDEPAELSPFADPREESIAVADDLDGAPLGDPVAMLGPGQQGGIGNLQIGTYPAIRMTITGGAQLIGMARARNVVISPGVQNVVEMQVRKPLAYFGSARTFTPVLPMPALGPPAPLLMLDTTLPPMAGPEAVPIGANAFATATAHDGRWMVAGGGGTLFLIDTGASGAQPETAQLPAGQSVRDVVFSPDDATLAVATDTGVGIAPLSTFGAELAITPVANVQRIAFSPDGQTVVALTGPPWSQVDCKTAAVSQVFAVSVAAPGSANMLPVQGLTGAATDLAYDRSGALVLATPCDGGTTGGALVGKGIFALGTYAGDLSGILGQLKLGPPAPDPGDPEILTQPSLIQVAVSTQAEPVQALLPVDRFPFEVLQDTVNGTPIDVPLEVQIPASSIVAYQIAASPDGTHLVFADKVHYDAVGLKVLDITSCLDPPACTMVVPFFSAQLDLHRDVYHVTEVDVKNGLIAFRKSVGLIDTPSGAGGCGITFTDCSQGPPCPPQPPQDCSDAQGFVANGVSVLLGSR